MSEQKKTTVLINLREQIRNPWLRLLYLMVAPVLERLMGISRINQVYDASKGADSPDEFSRRVLSCINVNYEIPEKELESLQKLEGPVLVVSNHPFGGIEALIMIRLLSRIRPDYKILANFLLLRIPELKPKFLGINPFGTKESVRENLASTRESIRVLKEGGLLAVFPAGEVSARKLPRKQVKDKAWDASIARIAKNTGATVVPIYFEGGNSNLFHFIGMLSMRLRTLFLIRELVYPAFNRVKFKIGKPIPPARLAEFTHEQALIEYLQSKTYLIGYHLTHPHIRLKRIRAAVQKPGMEKIIPPIDSAILTKEISQLSEDNLLVDKGEMQVFQAEARDIPQTLREIGRLREIAFRASGEGSGKAVDLDIYDDYYIQLFVWNKEKQEVVGGYRIGKSDEILNRFGKSGLYTISLFKIKYELFDQIGPSLEMGRSFVREEYQKSYLPLMLLWMGIGHFVQRNLKYRFLFGPVSITNDFHTASQSLLISFLRQNSLHAGLKDLVSPRKNFKGDSRLGHPKFYNAFSIQNLNDVQELISEIETQNLKVPILLKHYLKLGGQLLAFNVDPDFNNVVDGLIIVDLSRTEKKMLEKYMSKAGVEEYIQYHEARPLVNLQDSL